MRAFLFDSSILMSHWNARRRTPLASMSATEAEEAAAELIDIHRTNEIVTPVYLEFIGGATNGQMMTLYEAYLNRFDIVDRGLITADDRIEARRLARRIPPGPNPKPRGFADCLIRAIAIRLRYHVLSKDSGMPR